jgi:hypothetical protein
MFGNLSRELGDFAAAKDQLKEALAIGFAMNDQNAVAVTLQAFASLCTDVADPCCAERLFGRAERLGEDLGGGAPSQHWTLNAP